MKPLEPAGFFAIRTPLLPFDALLAWAEGPTPPNADRDTLRARLGELVARPEVREALFVASPSLERELAHWHRQPASERGQRIERALVRYVLRMAGRPTPFGLFAGCGSGPIVSRTDLHVPPTSGLRRRTRLDQEYVTSLTRALAADRALRRTLRYRANETLYAAAGRRRYCEARGDGARRAYHLVAVDPSEALDAALGCARQGASFDAIVNALTGLDGEATRDEAEAFVDELIDAQLLVDELAPAVVGDWSLGKLGEQLRGSTAGRPVAERIARVEAGLRAIDEAGLGQAPERYAHIVEELTPLPARADQASTFQVDLWKPGEQTSLGERHAREIARGAAILCRLGRPHRTAALERFKKLFRERFGDTEVPLMAALDDDVGVGFDGRGGAGAGQAPLLEGLPFPSGQAEAGARWLPSHDVLLRKWGRALRDRSHTIVLDDADVDALAGPPTATLPTGFAAVVSLLASPLASAGVSSATSPAGSSFAPPSPVAESDFDVRIFIRAITGSSGASLLARFADTDPALLARLRALVEREEAAWPDVLFAEIAHLPPGRAGNILLRPRLRRHELPALGRGEGPETTRLSLSELFVCVRDERVVLRSKRYDREIIPRLTTAHRFDDRSNVALYRFLSSLQFEGTTAGLAWNWGPLTAAEFLPRVEHGRFVFSRARWRLGADQVRSLVGPADADARFEAAQALRRELGWPRFLALLDGDGELPIDLDNALSIEAGLGSLGRRDVAVVEELFPGDDALAARGPEGRYVHELIVPLLAPSPAPRPIDPPPLRVPASVARHAPGGDWLYAKLSCSHAAADRVLAEAALPVARGALASGAASRWFFVRYDDPHWHVRLRVFGDRARLRREVQPALEDACAPLLEDGTMWRLAYDTYEREVERYGGAEGMAAAEAIFHADSEAFATLLPGLRGDSAGDLRWQATLLGMNALLDDLGLDAAGRRGLVGAMRASFALEFPTPGDALRHGIGAAYRPRRAAIEALFAPGGGGNGATLREAFALRSTQAAEPASRLRTLAQSGRLTRPLPAVAAALLHMHANRWLASAAREHEAVLYDFLERTYEARAARQGRKAP